MTLRPHIENFGGIVDNDAMNTEDHMQHSEGYRSFTKFRLRILVILLFYFITASVRSC